MNPTAIQYALQILTALPQLLAAGFDVAALVQQARDRLQTFHDEGRDPTDAEWQELDDQIGLLRGQLHGPAGAPAPGST